MLIPSRFDASVIAAKRTAEIESWSTHPFAKNAKGWATRRLFYVGRKVRCHMHL
jgi:hypothetical protein